MSAESLPAEPLAGQLSLSADFGAPDAAGELTIGEVLSRLQPDFPDLTISKIRYYERQGLLAPARTAAGYRKFTAADVRRLHFVLTAVRDHYLPLKVIKERLAATDGNLDSGARLAAAPGGLEASRPLASPDASTGAGEDRPANGGTGGTGGIGPDSFSFEVPARRLSRRELLRESGLDDDQLTELEAYGLICARGATSSYEADALKVARIVNELNQYGFQARHLRPVKAAVDREVGLVEQVLTPLVRQSSRDARSRAEDHARGYAALSVRLHIALLEAALRAALR